MAHHSADLPDMFKNEAARMGFGATGEYTMGKLNDTDEGGIRMGVAADVKNQRVLVNFGTPVAWIGFTYEQAMGLSASFRDKAFELRGIRQ